MTNSADQTLDAGPAGETGWRAVGKLHPSSLGAARELALNIAQWPARIANSYVAGATSAERLSLQWNVAENLLVTPSFDRDIAVALEPATLQMWFLANGRRVPHQFDPEGRSPAEAEAWILVELLHRGIEPTHFTKTLPYDLPDLMSGDAEQYSPQSHAAELCELAAWYHNAAANFVAVAADIGAAKRSLTCNPRDLSMRCRLELDEAEGNPIDLGFSPGTHEIDEPYFYVERAGGTPAAQAIMRATTLIGDHAPQGRLAAFLRHAVNSQC